MTTVDGYVNRVLAQYDRNGDGRIAVRGEATRRETYREPDPAFGDPFDPHAGTAPIGGRPRQRAQEERGRLVTDVYSIDALAKGADANGDGFATRAELQAAVRRFDANGDGKLATRGFWGWLTGRAKDELDKLEAAFGERLIAHN